MTTPLWCLLIVILIPYVLAGLGGYFKKQQLGTVDNDHPRQQAALLEGPGARAVAAQANAWEAATVFTAAVFVAHVRGVEAGAAALASLVFVAARVAHAFLYISGLSTLRSLSFTVAFVAALALFVMAIRA